MIRSIEIKDLYDKGDVDFVFTGEPFILTGDNGAGKTTIIDIIYSTITSNFEKLYQKKFNELSMKFFENRKGLNEIVIKRNEKNLKATYYFNDSTTHTLNIKKDSRRERFWFSLEKIVFPTKKLNPTLTSSIKYQDVLEGYDDIYIDHEHPNQFYNNLEEVIQNNEEIEFLSDLRDSILYFPTYRRIDLDLQSYIEATTVNQSPGTNRHLKILQDQLKNIEKEVLKDRRVIGVGDEDINSLFKAYSEELSKFKSERLSILLRDFVKYVIGNISDNEKIKNEEIRFSNNVIHNTSSKSTPESLIGLAELLNLDIDESKIDNYFEKKEKLKERINNNIQANKKKKNTSRIEESILSLLLFSSMENQFISELSRLYEVYQEKLNSFLIPITFLQNSVDLFFNGRVEIKINDDDQISIYKYGKDFPFNELSTGEKQLLTIFAYSGLGINSETFPSLVLIDEPELSLHIKWQMNLLSQINTKENIQLMVATHSPYIADDRYDDSTWQLGDIDG